MVVDRTWEHAKSIGAEVSGGGIGMPANVAKAAWGLHQGSQEGGGKPISEWMGLSSKTHPEGNPIFGASPKVGPFAGSFLDESPPFHVTDVHMGGIAFPHLSGVKGSGQNINPSGSSTGDEDRARGRCRAHPACPRSDRPRHAYGDGRSWLGEDPLPAGRCVG